MQQKLSMVGGVEKHRFGIVVLPSTVLVVVQKLGMSMLLLESCACRLQHQYRRGRCLCFLAAHANVWPRGKDTSIHSLHRLPAACINDKGAYNTTRAGCNTRETLYK
jgi:hypothetical protein